MATDLQEPPQRLPPANSDRAGAAPRARGARRAAASGLPPKPAHARYYSLDMWRGVACMMLVFYHSTFYAEPTFRPANPATWSLASIPLYVIRMFWMGVPIFFVISGYCIAASIDSLRRKDHSLTEYVVRRLRRIYPPLWAGCILVTAFTLLLQWFPTVASHTRQLPRLAQFSALTWLSNLTAMESWVGPAAQGDTSYLMSNTWTLCYEEQFYLVMGLLLAFAASRFFAVCAWLTVTVLVARHFGPTIGLPSTGLFWDGHWLMFAAGILVYQVLNYQTGRARWPTYCVLAAGLVYGATWRLLGRSEFEKHLGEYIFIACGFAWSLIILKRWDGTIAEHKLLSPITWCGRRSYSIYLTHYPLVVTLSSLLAMHGVDSELGVAAITVPLCVVLSIPLGWLFHAAVERRFLNTPQ